MSGPAELDAYDYALPAESIAQQPPEARDGARLLVLDRSSGRREHSRLRDLPAWLRAGDLLVRNTSRVLPARLRGRKATGGAAEALLLGPALGERRHRALVRTRGRLRPGLKLRFGPEPQALDAELVAHAEDGECVLAFGPGGDPYALGEMPMPPYIRRETPEPADRERYQTVYAQEPGSVAAPTAGLHLTRRLLAELESAGVAMADVVLHVGPGTFRPLSAEALREGRLHREAIELPAGTARQVADTRQRGGRVLAVGTTSARVLESRADETGTLTPGRGETDLFLRPGDRFRATDALLTNFHLPRSSLLLLVCAFAGREFVLESYREAIREGYRFYSYGDAMLVL